MLTAACVCGLSTILIVSIATLLPPGKPPTGRCWMGQLVGMLGGSTRGSLPYKGQS